MTEPRLKSNPFPGLRSFEPEEGHLFFGRDHQIEELISRLDRYRFLAVVGTSGCGKSSLVRAGLLPSLSNGHEGLAGNSWRTLLFKAGGDPFRNLSKALLGKDEVTGEAADTNLDEDAIYEQLRASQNGFSEVASSLGLQKRNLVIVVDQFEELFTFQHFSGDDNTSHVANEFVQALLQAIAQPEMAVYIVLTMRSDFLGNCTEFEGLTEVINNGQYLIPRLTFEQRKETLIGPIQQAGGTISDRLVNRILDEVGEAQDQLPTLQHTLMRIWDYWVKNRVGNQQMDYHEYEAVGKIEGALSIHAEEAFAMLRDDQHKKIAEGLFKALTDLGSDNKGTRRPTQLSEVCRLTNAKEPEVMEVVEVFRASGRAFLMPPVKYNLSSETILDISHESLMRKWGRLKHWVEEEILSAELYLRLCESSQLYQAGKAGLLGQPELQLAINWQRENEPNLSWAQRYNPDLERAINFLEHSTHQHNLKVNREQARQKRELKRAKFFSIIMGLASIVSLLFLLLAFILKFEAEDSERKAIKQKQLAVSKSNLALEQTKEAIAQKRISEQQQEIAYQQRLIADKNRNLANEQSKIARQQEQIAVQQKAVAVEQKQLAIEARDDAVKQEKIAVEQRTIADENRKKAETSEAKTKRLRLLAVARNIAIRSTSLDVEESKELVNLLALQAFEFNKNNEGSPYQPEIYQALSHATGNEKALIGHKDAVRAMAFGTDENTLLSGSEDGEVLLWDIRNATPVKLKSPQAGSSIRSLAMSKKGNWAAAGNFQGEISLWDSSTKKHLKTWTHHSGIVSGLTFSPEKKALFTCGTDSNIFSLDLENLEKPVIRIAQLDGKGLALSISNDGKWMACGTSKGTVLLFDLTQEKAPSTVLRSDSPVSALCFRQNGKQLIIGQENGQILVRSTSLGNPEKGALLLRGHSSAVRGLNVHPLTNDLVSASLDGTLKIWNLNDPSSEPITIDRHQNWVWATAFNPNGREIASGSQDKTIRMWAADSEQMAQRVCATLQRNLTQEEWVKYVGKDIPYQKTCASLPAGSASTQTGIAP